MVVVSFIIPAHNAGSTIVETLLSIEKQEYDTNEILLELSIFDDGSTDDTFQLCQSFIEQQWTRGRAVLSRGETPRGPGFARNACVKQCTGQFLCFNDADDISLPNRARVQLEVWRAQNQHETLVGSRFTRIPEDATRHYAAFLNSLTAQDLYLKQYRELTLIQPTWFLSREFFLRLGGYPESLAEDLHLFNTILDCAKVKLCLCPGPPLVLYRHISGSVSSKTSRKELVQIRANALQRRVLANWSNFSVWGAGRDGRVFFECLPAETRRKITCYVDVDANKIRSGFHHSGQILPVRHFTEVTSPFIVCVALGRTNGELEANIASRGFVEGVDYWHFN